MADTSSKKKKKRDTTSKDLWFAAGLPKRAAEQIEKRKKTLDSI